MRLTYVLFALAFIGLITWPAFMGPHSSAAPASIEDNRSPRQVAASTLTTPEHNARVSDAYGKLPLQFEVNEGQSDARVKFLARGSGYNFFLTGAEAVLALSKSTAPDAIETEPAEAGISPAGRHKQVRSEAQARTKTQTVVRIRLLGANPAPGIQGGDQLPGKVNYFIGNDPAKWRPGIATYARVDYKGVYPGVDVVYYGNQGQLEYDLVVAPGTNPDIIQLKYDGPKSIRMDHDGNLVVHTDAGDLRQQKPRIYQLIDGVSKDIEGGYVIRGKNKFGFKIARYDHRQPLIIDPILTYSTYLGGNGSDQGLGIALDSAGNAYVTGSVASTNFPTQGPIQTVQSGGDLFVAKLNSAGTALVYSTYLGGAAFDQGNGIAVDASGNAYVTGLTDSFNFPVAAAIQAAKSGSPFFKSINGGSNWNSSATGLGGANVRDVAINPTTPATIYTATEIGVFKSINGGGNWSATGLFNIFIEAVAIDPVTTSTLYAGGFGAYKSTNAGNTWSFIGNGLLVSGFTPSVNAIVIHPTTPATLYAGTSGGVFRSTNGGANWTAINNGLTVISGNTTFVPTVNALAIDPTNTANLYAGTSNGVFKSTNSGGNWGAFNSGLFDTFLNAIVVDPTNPATLYAATFSGVFKSTNGASNWTLMNTGLTNTSVNALIIDPTNLNTLYAGTSGGVFKSISGAQNWSAASNGITTLNIAALALDRITPANVYAGTTTSSDAFVTKLNFTGSALLYSTYLGGTDFDQGNGIALDPSGNAHITGETSSTNFPLASPRQPARDLLTDAFVTKLNSAGSFVYSTYLGGNSVDQGRGIAVDGSGNAYVTGNTFSTNFPTASANQLTKAGNYDAFVTKLNSTGFTLVYSTYLGGALNDVGRAIAVDGVGQSYVTGETSSLNFPMTSALQGANGGGSDAFVTKLNSAGTGFVYSTYLGGSSTDQAFGIAADAAGNAYLTGQTQSFNFPVRASLQPFQFSFDAFVTKINSTGSALVYSTYLGGFSTDQGRAIAVDGSGNPYVTGITFSTFFFPTANPFQSTLGGSSDAFVAKLGPAADLSITMTDSPDPATTGNNLTYTMIVTNNGELNATGVRVTDPLPSGVTFVSANTTQGSCTQSSGTVTCSLGNLNNGATVTVTIVVIPTTTTPVTLFNTGTVSANEPDGNIDNNSATQTTAVNATDLSVSISDSPDPVNLGANLTYTIPITNNGPSQAIGVTLTDILPSGATFVSASSTQGSCSQSTGTVTCNLGSLNNGATVTVTIIVTPTRVEVLTNTVDVTATNADPKAANNSATEVTVVNGATSVVRNLRGFTANSLGRNDDLSTAAIPLGFPVNFFGNSYTSVFVNNNGNVTFDSALGTFTPFDLTSTQTVIIAPFFADVDTGGSGSAVVTYGTDVVNGRQAFGVNYINVGYYSEKTDKLNTFQLVLINRSDIAPGNFDIELNYNKIQWETGEASDGVNGLGGSSARVGYSNGTRNLGTFFELNGSAAPGAFLDSNTSTGLVNRSINSIQLGRYVLEVRGGNVTTGDVAVTLADSPDPVSVGSNLTYTATVSNNSSSQATGVTLTDTLPAGTTFVSANVSQGTCAQAAGIVTCNIGNMPATGNPGATATATIVVRPSAVGTLTNTVNVSGNETDTNPSNNTATATTSVVAFSISGRVTDGSNNGISGVIITLSGSQTGSTTTDANGNYSFANLLPSGNYTVTPSKASFIFTPPSQSFNNLNANQTANFTGTPVVNISGRVTDGNNNGISGVQVTLSGTLTRVVQTDATGNYSFNNLVGGGNYSVIASSPLYVFAPPRFDFTNLNSNQTANFVQVPNAVPSPTPALADNFAGAERDPAKWNLGTATQPAGAFDPQVTVAQTSGQLVITPRSNVSGPHYNGYVSVNAFNLTGGTASVEVVTAATGGADTIFAIGSDSNNFFRFKVHTAGAPNGLAPVVKNQNGIEGQVDPTLLLQVVIAGQLTTLDIAYDSVQHHFMRFRHESAQVSPPSGAIVFEAGPTEINYTVLRRTLFGDKPVDPMTIELSAGTTGATNGEAAKFDNVKLVLSTFQFSAGAYSVGETEGSVLITVTRVGDKSTVGTVDFATKDGTALQGTKYTQTTGKLTFAANEASKTFTVSVVNNTLAEGDKTVNLELSNATGSGLNSPGRAVLTIIDNEAVLTAGQAEIKTWTFQGTTYAYLKLLFPNAGYRVANWGQATRTGNDFSADAVVEKFTGASVQAVTTTAQIYDLGTLAPGSYNFTFKNSGTVVKTLAFTVAAPPFPPNSIDNAREFVKQQYRDFLNREADQAGEDFWTDNITKCSDPARRPAGQTEAQCTVRQRETTSGAFFQSPEFQYTGYYVYRMYQGALGRQPKLSEFTPDAQFVGAGILVNGQLSGAKINQNKTDFAQQFVNCTDAAKYRCAEFKAIYDGLNNQQYVDKLFLTTGVNASASDRAALVNGLNANPATETRASVLQKVVDGIVVIAEGNQQFTTTYGQAFYNSESNRAFVLLQYFGYMKRDPDDAGYAFWLGKLNQFGGNFVNAELVLAFISSPEYRARFGQP